MKSINTSIYNENPEYLLPSNLFCEQNKNNEKSNINKFDYSGNNQINTQTEIVSTSN